MPLHNHHTLLQQANTAAFKSKFRKGRITCFSTRFKMNVFFKHAIVVVLAALISSTAAVRLLRKTLQQRKISINLNPTSSNTYANEEALNAESSVVNLFRDVHEFGMNKLNNAIGKLAWENLCTAS